MSKYTIEVNEIIENIWREGHPEEEEDLFHLTPFTDAFEEDDEKIKYARDIIFSFDFPCYGDTDDKKDLEYDILSDFYYREICCDSVAKWQRLLRNRLHDVMPKYVAIYNSQTELIASDILNPYRIDEVRNKENNRSTATDRTTNANSTSENNAESNSSIINHNEGIDNTINKMMDTPQALMESNKDYLTTMTKDDNTYKNDISSNDTSNAINKSISNNDSSMTESGNETGAEKIKRLLKGNLSKHNNAELVEAYQNVIKNINELIMNELKDLFYGLY